MMNESENCEIESWLLRARFAPPDPSLRARVLHAGAVRSRWPSGLSMISLAGVFIAVVAAGGMNSSSGPSSPSVQAAVETASAPVGTTFPSAEAAQPVARPAGSRRGRAAPLLVEDSCEEPALLGVFGR